MSKKRGITRRSLKRQRRSSGRTRVAGLTILALLFSVLTTFTMTRFAPLRQRIGLAPLISPTPQPTPSLSKEYIYAGGRLVATEEPMAGGPPPTNLIAVASSGTSVSLTWAPPPSGNVTGYVVERRHSLSVPPIEISTGSTTPAFIDSSASIDTAYLFRVRAVFSGGSTSSYSNQDLATTVQFTDQPLGSVPIQAIHLIEARRAVNAVRFLVGLSASSWTYPDPLSFPAAQRAIYLEDMTELRTNLNMALAALQIIPLPEDPTLGRSQSVRRQHLQDVRTKVQ